LHGGTTWDLVWWDDVVKFSDRRGALLFLLPFKADAQFMWELRHLLAERNRGYALSRGSDQEVLEEVASLLASKQLWLTRTYRAVEGGFSAEKAEALPEVQPLPALPRQPAPPAEPPPDEPIFRPNIDAAAIAAAQREAAQSGVPFCEE
jgi:hypothetical protein